MAHKGNDYFSMFTDVAQSFCDAAAIPGAEYQGV